MCRGRLGPRIVSTDGPGTLALNDDDPVLACPWHGWEFDARTGLCVWGKPGYRIRMHRVTVEDGRVQVSPEEDRSRDREQPSEDAP